MKTRTFWVAVLIVVGLIAVPGWLAVRRLERWFNPPALTDAEEARVCDWIRQTAVCLTTVEAGNGVEDMQPLKAMIGNARLVCLGEDAHLNRDFAKAKHRMLEFLVTEMGFSVFVIEAPFDGALELNDYLLTGDGVRGGD